GHRVAAVARALHEPDVRPHVREVLLAPGIRQLVEDDDLVGGARVERDPHVGRADEPGSARYEHAAHSSVMSEPSPNTNLNTRGSAWVREIDTPRPISDASMRPGRARTCAPARPLA